MEKTEEIIKRYYRGETSIEEEKFLKAQYRSGHLKEDPFLSLSYPSLPLPSELNEKIRQAIRQQKKCALRRIYITVGSIAFSQRNFSCLHMDNGATFRYYETGTFRRCAPGDR